MTVSRHTSDVDPIAFVAPDDLPDYPLPGALRGFERQAVRQLLRQVATRIAGCEKEIARLQGQIRDRDHELERRRYGVSVPSTVREEEVALQRDAQQQADAIIAAGQEQARQIVAASMEHARQLLASAEAQAGSLAIDSETRAAVVDVLTRMNSWFAGSVSVAEDAQRYLGEALSALEADRNDGHGRPG